MGVPRGKEASEECKSDFNFCHSLIRQSILKNKNPKCHLTCIQQFIRLLSKRRHKNIACVLSLLIFRGQAQDGRGKELGDKGMGSRKAEETATGPHVGTFQQSTRNHNRQIVVCLFGYFVRSLNARPIRTAQRIDSANKPLNHMNEIFDTAAQRIYQVQRNQNYQIISSNLVLRSRTTPKKLLILPTLTHLPYSLITQ